MYKVILALIIGLIPLSADTMHGELDNGIHYLFTDDNVHGSEAVTVELIIPTGTAFESDETAGYNELIKRVVFWGTESFDRKAIIDTLEQCGLEVHPDCIATVGEERTLFQITIPNQKSELIPVAIHLLAELSQKALLTNEAIEIEKKNSEELSIKSILPKSLREFYQSWYRPDHFAKNDLHAMLIHVHGNVPFEISLDWIESAFLLNEPLFITNGLEISSYTTDVDLSETDYIVVDDKIFMAEPWALQTQSFNFWTGMFFFTAAAAGLVAGLCGFYPALSIPASILVIVFGGVCVGKSHLNDPEYVKACRVDDLSGTFTRAYKNGHYRYTLTPRESRRLFIHEHYYSPNIETISQVYDLYSPDFTCLFTSDEIGELRSFVHEYRKEVNELTRIRDNIEEALQNALKKARNARDTKLEESKSAYDNNFSIVRERSIRRTRDQHIQKYKDDYTRAIKNIDSDEELERLKKIRDDAIQAVNDWYEQQINQDLLHGVEVAKETLRNSQARIHREYEEKVEEIKYKMGYQAAIEEYKAQLKETKARYNDYLVELLSGMDPDEEKVDDYLIHPTLRTF